MLDAVLARLIAVLSVFRLYAMMGLVANGTISGRSRAHVAKSELLAVVVLL